MTPVTVTVTQLCDTKKDIEINRYMEKINVVVTDLNSMDMFLEYNWLVKYNSEFNWENGTIQFTRCLKECKIQH